MSKRRIVVDTNVLVSAMLSSESVSRKLLDSIIHNDTLLLSESILSEFLSTILSEKFDKYASLQDRYHYLHLLIQNVSWVTVAESITLCRDPKDDKFLELAVSGNAEYIITGDKDLLSLRPFRNTKIVTPSEFLSVN
jgi:putative PIN family toxin of toxin-antitoxin system